MAYPSLEQYNQALRFPQYAINDPELKTGSIQLTGLKIPLALCGGFALTYSLDVAGKRYAVRCFHRQSEDLERRYAAVAERLRHLSTPYFLPFAFLPGGVRVDGNDYPLVRMAWASGTTLSEFLESQHANAHALTRLRASLGKLAAFLEERGIAHGDLQPGNLMVSDNGASVTLIDYDGMFVESLRGMQATETGQRNFQHPARSKHDFNERLDRFSFIALDVALLALASDPDLWRRSMSEPEAVVFRSQDYANPGASSIFADLLKLAPVRKLATRLARVASAPMDAVPSLADFLAGRNIPGADVVFGEGAVGRLAYRGAYPVLDATDFRAFLSVVGEKVELIGRVVDVSRKLDSKGNPYIFINFSDWRGKAVKIAIWNDALRLLDSQPDTSWVGKWLAMTAMVDPLYKGTSKGKRGSVSYEHLSLPMTQRGQMQVISAQEAAFRLKGSADPDPTPARPANSTVVSGMTARTSVGPAIRQPPAARPVAPQAPPPAPHATPTPSASPNGAVLEQMRLSRQRTAAPSPQVQRVAPPQPPAPAPALRPPAPNAASHPANPPPNTGFKWARWVALGMILVALWRCARGG